jgi:hypothetical protein
MPEISLNEQSERDWDWYASDQEGMIGHFATAGCRSLPRSVKQDRDAALRLIHYFDVEAPKSTSYIVRPGAEADEGGWKDDLTREQCLKSFVDMASAGLFSYDTFLVQPDSYYLVALPDKPIYINQLPEEIRSLVIKIQARVLFAKSIYITEAETLSW